MYWKTITTYLIDWSPTWIKTVELSNRIWKCVIIPRSKLKEMKERQEMTQPAIYFLFWIDEEWKNLAYIWEAENLINRLWNHDTNKDFWDIVIAFVSKDNNLTKADVKFLEAKAIEKAKKTNRYKLLNWIEPIPNNLPEYQVSTMNEFLENIDLLISAIWFPILKEIVSPNENSDQDNIFSIKTRGTSWKWAYTDEWFLIFKWSKWIAEVVKSFQWKAKRLRDELLEKWIIKIEWEYIIFIEDYLWSSPSFSASILTWRPTNWWIEWKNKDWKTLDEIERKILSN